MLRMAPLLHAAGCVSCSLLSQRALMATCAAVYGVGVWVVVWQALELPFGTADGGVISGAFRAATERYKVAAMLRLAQQAAQERGRALTAEETAAVREEARRRRTHAAACAEVLRDPLQRVALEAKHYMQLEELQGFWG